MFVCVYGAAQRCHFLTFFYVYPKLYWFPLPFIRFDVFIGHYKWTKMPSIDKKRAPPKIKSWFDSRFEFRKSHWSRPHYSFAGKQIKDFINLISVFWPAEWHRALRADAEPNRIQPRATTQIKFAASISLLFSLFRCVYFFLHFLSIFPLYFIQDYTLFSSRYLIQLIA